MAASSSSSSFLFKEFAHLQIPLQDVVSATSNFADENLIGHGGFGDIYKGQLSRSEQLIDIVAKRLHGKYGQGYVEFWKEISMLSRVNHKNIVSIVGFCDEPNEKIIIIKYEVKGSLDICLTQLTWMQRLNICVDVARALSYLHHDTGRGYCVIHGDIKSGNILLDENWEAKVCDFGFSIENLATRRHRLVIAHASGTPGYMDPVYLETNTMTLKSDVYSFGVVLFEVLYGRKASIRDDGTESQFLAPLARKHYEDGKLGEMIDPNLRNQMDSQSFAIFSNIAYNCLNRQRTQRPYMESVVRTLEKALELQRKHENPAHSKSTGVEGTMSNHLKEKNLEHLKIQLSDILLATENFAKTHRIGYGGYGVVYKGELDCFDNKSSLAMEGKNKDELAKKRRSVAIKQIISRLDGQGEQGFFAEIEMLTTCKHQNIVSLLGFCDEGPQRILVYELASNGSLDDYLGNTNHMTTLTWTQRIKMCLDVARGLSYLHTTMEDKERIVHRDIKSANILLYDNWEAKIADFGLSRFHPGPGSTLNTNNVVGTEVYLDPEYLKTGKLKKESDVYSFGVVLFEVLCGRLAYDEIYNDVNDKGLPCVVRRSFNEGVLMEMVDPKIKEETENHFTLNRGPSQDSLDTFAQIAYQCLAETQTARPTMEVVIKELEKALYFQENIKDNLKISLEDIKLATENFSDKNCIGRGGFGKVYKGEVPHGNGHNVVVAKRLDRVFGQGATEFMTDLEILFDYKHENVIGLVGYCHEMGENVIVYEYASEGSLDKHLKNDCLTWTKRLEICIGAARGLDFLHGASVLKQEVVIHRDIKSSNILLTGDWKAKLADFGLSLICPIYQEIDYVFEYPAGTLGYADPLYLKTSVLTKESDIYSFGVVLFEILCGRLAFEKHYKDDCRYLSVWVKEKLDKGRVEEIVFEGIKKQIVSESLTTYCKIAYQCLQYDREKRPKASEVMQQLEKALEFQEDYEVWEPKLPADYKQIIQMSKNPEIYSNKMKKDIYDMFSKGILVQEGKVWFSLNGNRERNELISARMFSYKNHRSYKWRSVPKSRFQVVAKMLDISNLKIQVQIKTQFLSPNVIYGVYLVFKFCDSRRISNTRMYVNLKYKMGNESLHAYFATSRDDTWMMIELYRFLNHQQDIDFAVLLESLSRYYCRSDAIYIEGIEFQAIDNVKPEEYKNLKEVHNVFPTNPSMDSTMQQLPKETVKMIGSCKGYVPDGGKEEPYHIPVDDGEKFWLSKVDGKKCHMLSAKVALYNSSNDKFFNQKPSTRSRFQEVIEILPRQVIGIKCRIESQMLSPDTNYACFLVFKFSEKCRGLHCPVKIRNLLHRKNKEIGIVYFRFPSLWNLHDTDSVPIMREDGWMEVNVWKFNSNDGLINDCIPISLKVISYEGTMTGLIVCGLEIRPM